MGYVGAMIARADMIRLGSGRWLMPLLAEMSGEGGARFAVLARRLPVSRSMLSRSLDLLESHGWLVRNPGHGHPLRPEYLLTDAGRPIAAWCARVMEERRRLGIETNQLGRWSLPLVHGLGERWKRFSSIEADLSPITPRALSLTLKQGLGAGLLDRRLEQSFPPLSLYGLTDRGRSLAGALA
jgi:DNA-binding HxlR family transcriptional regulator